MKRNYNIYIWVSLMILLASTSCKKWLDVLPLTEQPFDRVFATETGFSQAMSGVYGSLTSTDLYGGDLTYGAMDLIAGYYQTDDAGVNTYGKLRLLYPYKRDNVNKDSPVIAIVDRFWSGLYAQVANLNNVLDYVDVQRSVFSGDNYKIIKGEAIGMRAFLHFDLLRMYGPSYVANADAPAIPFVDTLSSLVTQRLTVRQATDRIISELQTALSMMESDPMLLGTTPPEVLAPARPSSDLAVYHNRRYRFNYYAVAATLARAYLWKGDKVNAMRYAKIIIDSQSSRFPWITNPDRIGADNSSSRDRTFTTEHIFALHSRAMETHIPEYFSTAGTTTDRRLYVTESKKNTIYENNTDDIRNQYLFAATTAGVGTNFFPTKLVQDANNSVWYKHQLPIIGVSEMYYIAAECATSREEALGYLNTVRAARKITSMLSATDINTDVLLQNEIRKEYQKEFITEGQLWYYYKRKDLDKPVLNDAYAGAWNKSWYVFDMPEKEYQYGGRE